jgi:nicotinamidase-related amidase
MGRCLEAKGAQFVRLLLPDSEDYFVLKPLHSAFYMTPLEVLLQHLQVETLILSGLTSNSCITVTAHDANMRGFDIFVPSDCSCARNEKEHTQALGQLEGMVGANLRHSASLRLPNLIRVAQISQGTGRAR